MTYIKQSKTPTLIQHGENDRRVPIPNAYELRQGLEDRGVKVEMIKHNRMDMLEDLIKANPNKFNKIWYMADGLWQAQDVARGQRALDEVLRACPVERGLELVRLLVEQLSGELTLTSSTTGGTDACLHFSSSRETPAWQPS
jgi:hypothetical protein